MLAAPEPVGLIADGVFGAYGFYTAGVMITIRYFCRSPGAILTGFSWFSRYGCFD